MDNPIAMPAHFGYELCEPDLKYEQSSEAYTLEDYFKGLQKICNDLDQQSDVKSAQVGGDHYQKAALQPWDIFLAWGLDPWAANVVKYILRFPHKNGLEDLKKAKHYVDFLIEHYDEVHEKYYEEG
jgi:Protein of unknwon function (DUF3310)